MKRLLAPVLLALTLAAPAAAETRNISGFTAVTAADRVTVEIITGQAYSVEVTGPDARRIRTRLDGRTLQIRDANRPWFGETPRLDAHVRITAPSLRGIAAVRGAEVEAALNGACDGLDVAAAMGGQAEIVAPECDAIDASASMGGEMRLEGACRALSASASMGGVIRAREMRCVTVDASASMGGDVQAYASRSYDASAAMGGAINVAGDATLREISSSLGGSVSDH
jgi:hypothetical protein